MVERNSDEEWTVRRGFALRSQTVSNEMDSLIDKGAPDD
jgi:hypothetical protein